MKIINLVIESKYEDLYDSLFQSDKGDLVNYLISNTDERYFKPGNS